MSVQPTQRAYVVLVDLAIEPQYVEAFLPLMLENASSSLSLEPGCQVFEVCQAPNDATRFCLYEVYDDEAAFRRHLDSAHFHAFNQQTSPYTISKAVRIFDRLNIGPR